MDGKWAPTENRFRFNFIYKPLLVFSHRRLTGTDYVDRRFNGKGQGRQFV